MTLIELLACISLMWIIKDSYITLKPREFLKSQSKFLNKLLSCSLCLGFWIGFIPVLVDMFLLNFQPTNKEIARVSFYPLATAGACWVADSLLNMVQEIWVYYKNIREENNK